MSKTLQELAFIDRSGFHVADFEEFLDFNRDAFRSIYGQDVNLDADTQDGQLVTHFAQAQYDLAVLCAAVFNAYSPTSASGEGLSRQVKINGMRRHAATRSTVDLKIIGRAGSGIVNGKVRDDAGRSWSLPAEVTIPVGGETTVTATCDELGAVRAAAGAVSRIATPTEGWISVVNEAEAVPGLDVESDVALRARQVDTTAMPSQALLKGILGEILNIDGVTRAKVYENDTHQTDENGIPSHSICAVVEGGDANLIAEAIRRRKTTGTGTHGTTAIALVDPQMMPITIRFFRPVTVHVKVKVKIKPMVGYSSTYGQQMKEQIAAYINGLGIGSTLYLSKLYVPANLEQNENDSTYDIEEILLGANEGEMKAQNIKSPFNGVPYCEASYVEVVTDD